MIERERKPKKIKNVSTLWDFWFLEFLVIFEFGEIKSKFKVRKVKHVDVDAALFDEVLLQMIFHGVLEILEKSLGIRRMKSSNYRNS